MKDEKMKEEKKRVQATSEKEHSGYKEPREIP
jgi:hypothetical protein